MDDKGTVDRYVAIGLDITERKRAEEALRASEERFRNIFSEAAEGILIADICTQKFLYANPAICKMLGYSTQELTSMEMRDIHPEKDLAHVQELFILLARGEKTLAENIPVLRKDGAVRYMDIRASQIMINGHSCNLGMFTDITDRKRAEEVLRASEERYRAILEQAADAIFIHDENGWIIDVNQKACQNLGYSREELLSKSIGDIDPEAIQTEKDKLWSKVIAGEHFTFESHQRRKDGSPIPVEVSLGSVHLPDRLVIIGTARDITDRKRAEEIIALTTCKLSLMNEVTYQFIQNKVTALSGYAELSKDVKTDVERLAFIEKEERILADIYQLIKNSKDYQEMGLTQLRWIPVEQSIRIAVSLVSPKQGISIEIHLHGLELYADPLIEKIFYKLIDNAEKHGKTTTRITFSCHETTDRLILTCENDGVDIPPERKVRLFERGVGEKSGFDLFFIRECLALYGMSIAETGEPGKGARFEITVPEGAYRFTETGVYRGENR